jgi:hypothetical protein
VLAPTASALAAITSLAVSLWVAYAQRRIQERQLKHDLYDKPCSLFLAVEEFVVHVQRVDGSVALTGDEFRRFQYAVEQAEFLFGADVVNYVNKLNGAVLNLHPKCFRRDPSLGRSRACMESIRPMRVGLP